MDNVLAEKISQLIDKYFTEKTKTPIKYSTTVYIRQVLNKRIEGYFSKSLLNEVLTKKGFLYKVIDETNYCYNISQKDIRILDNSFSILNSLSEKTNYTFSDYVRLHKIRNVDLYKYKFKNIIKYKFKSDFIERNYTELDIYNVIAKELSIDVYSAKRYIETFNSFSFPEIPEDILTGLLRLFDIEKGDCLTNINY